MILSLDDERDLNWYFNESDGSYGLRSSFGVQIERLAAGLVGPPTVVSTDDEMVRRIDARNVRRLVHRALMGITNQHSRTLQRVYEMASWPVYVCSRFGKVAGVALSIGPDDLTRMCYRVVMRRGDNLKAEEAVLMDIQLKADAAFAAACRAYVSAKGVSQHVHM